MSFCCENHELFIKIDYTQETQSSFDLSFDVAACVRHVTIINRGAQVRCSSGARQIGTPHTHHPSHWEACERIKLVLQREFPLFSLWGSLPFAALPPTARSSALLQPPHYSQSQGGGEVEKWRRDGGRCFVVFIKLKDEGSIKTDGVETLRSSNTIPFQRTLGSDLRHVPPAASQTNSETHLHSCDPF